MSEVASPYLPTARAPYRAREGVAMAEADNDEPVPVKTARRGRAGLKRVSFRGSGKIHRASCLAAAEPMLGRARPTQMG